MIDDTLALDCRIVTIFLSRHALGSLSELNLRVAGNSLRKKLGRSDLGNIVVAGGLEVACSNSSWVFHAHLCVGPWHDDIGAIFEKQFGRSDVRDPIRIQPISDPAYQLSYLLKLHTYKRLGEFDANGKGLPVPLSDPELLELLTWSRRFDLSDHRFLMGLRFRGTNVAFENLDYSLVDAQVEKAGKLWKEYV